MAKQIQMRRGTSAQWTAANPILAAGEAGFATDQAKLKMGDGITRWADLRWFLPQIPPEGIGRIVGSDAAVSGNMTNAGVPYVYQGKNNGTQPLTLAVTPSIDCWWPVSGQGLARVLDAAWYRANMSLVLTPADAVLPGHAPYSSILHHNAAADWGAGGSISGMFALSVGITYTVSLGFSSFTGGTWNYYCGANAYAYIQSPGIVPR